ncbi:unnamed protein product [Ixodes hexagonus]
MNVQLFSIDPLAVAARRASPKVYKFAPLYKRHPPSRGATGPTIVKLELREDEAVRGGTHTRTRCQSSSDKGSYCDDMSTDDGGGAAGVGPVGPPPPPPAATLVPTGLLGATAMERTESAENG